LLPDLSNLLDIFYTPTDADSPHLHLLQVDYPAQATGGSNVDVTLTWQTLAHLPADTMLSLRLVQEDTQGDTIVAQLDDTLVSGWFSANTLPANQHGLTYMPIPVPLGTLPGTYRLQLVIYADADEPWVNSQGSILLNLDNIDIVSPPNTFRPSKTESILPNHDFNGEIELIDYGYTVSRLRQGKGFGLRLLWRAQQQPADNYTLLVEQLDATGNVIRSGQYQPVKGQAPTSLWQSGQFIRDQIDLVIPAGTPPGEQALQVRLSWLRPDGSKLNVRRWLIPIGNSLTLGWLEVLEKEGRVFETPDIAFSFDTNLENKIRFAGYNVSPNLNLKSTDCAAGACQLDFEFYWQGLSEMQEIYQVFLHVVDAEGQIVAQQDWIPGRGKQPTTGWLPNEVIFDPLQLTLPDNISPGQYKLFLGMYLPPDGPRLLILDDMDQPVSDSIEVGSIEILP
jgi:hypothetical protein